MGLQRNSQTTTEYLIVLGVLLIITLIVVSLLGGFRVDNLFSKTSDIQFVTQGIGVTSYTITDYGTTLSIRNNRQSKAEIDSISLNGELCPFFIGENPTIGSGRSQSVRCPGISELSEDTVSWTLEINYTDLSTGSSFSQNDASLTLSSDVGSQYLSQLADNPYWNASINGCWDTTQDPHPLCTCYDLNRTRDQLGWDYQLQNDIDFVRCQSLFGDVGWNSGTGWPSISGPFTGTFDGDGYTISNLYTTTDAFITTVDDAVFTNIGFLDVNISGTYLSGAIFSYGYNSNITNSYVTGSIVTTGDQVGGLVGSLDGGKIEDSFAIATLSDTGTGVGGLLSYCIGGVSIINSYADVIFLSSPGGGLCQLGDGNLVISNAYWINYSDSISTCVQNNVSHDTNGCEARNP